MQNQEKIQLTIYLPMGTRTKLQAMAAQKMLEHPQKNFSAASIAASMLIEHLTPMEQEEKN
ncbi:MAG: hypothetical protein HOJ48_19730 [Desulfobacula sp.]|jgi:hypothetical protein|nr:hypothetical protein [Desulfobacula sp.]MBT6341520.1 hypothetical protein [Desulfobacula sp.]